MKSFQTLKSDYGTITLDTSATNIANGMIVVNDEIRRICSSGDFPFMHKDRTLTTVASTQTYVLPYDIDSVSTVKVVVGTVIYSPRPCNTQREWDILNYGTYTSDAALRYFVKDGSISLWPIPATTSNVVTINGKLRIPDLNTIDDATRTITTLANGSQALTVSAGLTAQMVGFWIRPTFSTTANTGDGRWYEIGGYTSATSGTLVRKYGGNSIAIGTCASTISQMPILPEAFHDLPLFVAAEQYWAIVGNANKSVFFGNKAKLKMEEFDSSYKTNINDPVIDDGQRNDFWNDNDVIVNPNFYPSGLHN